MKVLVILNGIARKRKYFLKKIYPSLKCDLAITEYAGHAEELAEKSDHDVIIVAGGDGTMSQVVNGVMKKDKQPALKLVPLGSGNDLSRSLKANTDQMVDIGVVELDGRSRYFINECSIGMGPEVVKKIAGSKTGNASIKYLSAIISTFFTHKPQPIEIKTENYHWQGDARVLAVANGKAFGHSIYIAPDAKMDDGKLNMFLCKGIPLAKFLIYLQTIKAPKKINDPRWIDYRLVESISINSETPLPVEADGELIGFTPVICGVRRNQIKILA
ncbi:MAG TPA: YegS/Rv2252/BmrU family lipid kinase [Cyclobacteriaceae bacterium]|nr:YegS/Rv2252/BmrU family lipid kinase [Cyclobacteriaceae bacterium]